MMMEVSEPMSARANKKRPAKLNQNDQPEVLAAKIDRLLHDTKVLNEESAVATVAHRQERYLVALVLLTRVSGEESDIEDDSSSRKKEMLEQLWSNHHEKLVQFAVRLLSPNNNVDSLSLDNNFTHFLRRLYSRLVANLATKLPTQYQASLAALGKALLGALSSFHHDGLSPALVADIELVHALDRIAAQIWSSREHRTDLESALNAVTNRCQSLTMNSTIPASTKPSNDNDPTNYSSDRDTNMMIQTLDALLPPQVVNNDNDTHEISWEQWGCVAATFVQRHAPQHLSAVVGKKASVPQYYSTLLTMICGNSAAFKGKASNKFVINTQHAWYEVLLQCTQVLAGRPAFQEYLVKNDQTLSLSRLLLALVSSPSSSADRLRGQAWLTMAILVETIGFEWTVTTSSSSSSSTKVPTWSTLVRLGSAEWRIQLSRHATEALDKAVPQESQTQPPQPTEQNDNSSIELIESCGRFVLATLSWAGQLADDQSSNSIIHVPLSGDALLTLRQALDDAANVVVRFLTLPDRQRAECHVHIQVVAARVLGGLLAELDVWDDFPRCGVTTRQVLQAFHAAIQQMTTAHMNSSQDDVSLAPFVVPALLILLQTAEDDDARLGLLRKAGLLNEKTIVPLVSHVCSHVINQDSVALVPSTCQLMELWLSMVPPPNDLKRVKRALVSWIQQALDQEPDRGSSAKNAMKEALSSAVGCFITLQGDISPGDEESSVIERALQRVGHAW